MIWISVAQIELGSKSIVYECHIAQPVNWAVCHFVRWSVSYQVGKNSITQKLLGIF